MTSLTAVVSGRELRLDRLDLPAVLIFHDRESAEEIPALQRAIRAEHPAASELLVASVVELRVPRLFRRLAGPAMADAYRAAAARLPRGRRPEDYVVILPDWEGKAAKAFSVEHPKGSAVVLVVRPGGLVVGRAPAEDVERIFELITDALGGSCSG